MRPERFELPAFWFVARRSIQLSYGRTVLLSLIASLSQRFSSDRAQSSDVSRRNRMTCASGQLISTATVSKSTFTIILRTADRRKSSNVF